MQLIPPPLEIHVVWHPEDSKEDTHPTARSIFEHFRRPVFGSLNKGLGIDTYFRSVPINELSNKPRSISISDDPDCSSLIVLLVGHNLIDAAETDQNGWSVFIDEIHDLKMKNDRQVTIAPVHTLEGLHGLGDHKIDRYFGKIGSINLAKWEQEKELTNISASLKLHQNLTHMAGRLLRKQLKQISGEHETIPVFVSHTKSDGYALAILDAFQEYFNYTTYDHFLDIQNLQSGEEFRSEILRKAGNCMMLMLRTNNFGSRRWCLIEILTAKMAQCPIVWLDAVTEGEENAPSELGNMPRLLLSCTDGEWSQVDIRIAIARLFDEALSYSYWKIQEILFKKYYKNFKALSLLVRWYNM